MRGKKIKIIGCCLMLLFLAGCQADNKSPDLSKEIVIEQEKEDITNEETTEDDIAEIMDEGVLLPTIQSHNNLSMAYDGEYFYFSSGGIYKVKMDTGESHLISSTSVWGLTLKDNWLYFLDHSNQLYKMSLNGEEVVQVLDQSFQEFVLTADGIVGVDLQGNIIRIDENESYTSTIAFGNFKHIHIYDNRIYAINYFEDDEIYEYTVMGDKGGVKHISTLSGPYVDKMIITEEFVFIDTYSGLYRMTLTGDDWIEIFGEAENVAVYDNYIYAVTDAGFSITRMSLDGSQRKVMKEHDERVYQLYVGIDHIFINVESFFSVDQFGKSNVTLNSLENLKSEYASSNVRKQASSIGPVERFMNIYNGPTYWEGLYDLTGDGRQEKIMLTQTDDTYNTWELTIDSSTMNSVNEISDFNALYVVDLNDDGIYELLYDISYRMFDNFYFLATIDGEFGQIAEGFWLIDDIVDNTIIAGTDAYSFDGVYLRDQNSNILY